MSDTSKPTFAAIITISLPGAEGPATANVVLTPPEAVPVNGRVKPLQDCTLADIQAFAQVLEEEVWQTYRAIKLLDLAQDEQVEVDVALVDETGQALPPLEIWHYQTVVLPPSEVTAGAPAEEDSAGPEAVAGPDAETAAETPPQEKESLSTGETTEDVAHAIEADEIEALPETTEPAAPAGEQEPAAAETTELEAELTPPDVLVSESILVHPEREVEETEAAEAVATPPIIPSQARVRVAGKRLPLGHPTWTAVDILIDEPALRSAQAHALSSPDREVAGMLVGPPPEKQPDGRYVVHVIDTIIAKYTVMQGASVTYTPESWRYVNDKLNERYPEESAVMVGWYHTHPGFGIFLSGMDQFIHRHFFTQIWHVALVLDPLGDKGGFFCWDRNRSRVGRYELPWPRWATEPW